MILCKRQCSDFLFSHSAELPGPWSVVAAPAPFSPGHETENAGEVPPARGFLRRLGRMRFDRYVRREPVFDAPLLMKVRRVRALLVTRMHGSVCGNVGETVIGGDGLVGHGAPPHVRSVGRADRNEPRKSKKQCCKSDQVSHGVLLCFRIGLWSGVFKFQIKPLFNPGCRRAIRFAGVDPVGVGFNVRQE